MLRVEAAGFGAGELAVTATPAARPGERASGFSSMYRSLHADIRDTIEHGFGTAQPATLASPSLPSQLGEGDHAWLTRYLAGGTEAHDADARGYADEDQRLAFLRDIAPWAERAGAELGTSPHIIAAHAALESNWGRQPVMAQGRSAYNLFGIKAGESWRGRAATSMTTEQIDGQMVRLPQRFRAYSGYDSAFRDYVRLLSDNPRYADALNAGSDARAFSRGLQKGGYATDGAYAEKLVKVARQVERMGRGG